MLSYHLRHLKSAKAGQHITSQSIRQQWGDSETVAEKVSKRRLEWLGHLARIPDHRTPKSACSAGCPNLAHGEAHASVRGMLSVRIWRKGRCTYGTKRQQHQGQGGEPPIDRPLQTSPTESNTKNKFTKCNAQSASATSTEKATGRGTNAYSKGGNQWQSSVELCSV